MDRWQPVTDVKFCSDWLHDEVTDRNSAESNGWRVKEWNDSPGAHHPVHDHPYDHRVVVLSGEMEFTVDGETYRVQPGDALDLPARVEHRARADSREGCRYWQLQPPE